MSKCQHCEKEYIPKRQGGKFCSTSCRVMRHQLVKRGEVWVNPTTGDEQYLASKLDAVGRSSVDVLAQIEGIPVVEGFTRLKALVQAWTGLGDNSIIRNIKHHEQEATAVMTDLMLRKMEAASVKDKRKKTP